MFGINAAHAMPIVPISLHNQIPKPMVEMAWRIEIIAMYLCLFDTCKYRYGTFLTAQYINCEIKNIRQIEITSSEQNPNKIIISGPDKQKVGQFAAEVREKRPPEPYKGKGIKYVDEYIRRKEGKTGKGGK